MKKFSVSLLIGALLLAALFVSSCVNIASDFESAHKVSVSFDELRFEGISGQPISDTALKRQSMQALSDLLSDLQISLSDLSVKQVYFNKDVQSDSRSDLAALAQGNWVVSVDPDDKESLLDTCAVYEQMFDLLTITYPFDSQRYALLNPFAAYAEQTAPARFGPLAQVLPFSPSFATAAAMQNAHSDAKQLFCSILCPPAYSADEKALIAADDYMRQKAQYLATYLKDALNVSFFDPPMQAFFDGNLVAKRIYRVTDTRAVRMGESTTYPPAHVKVGEILTYVSYQMDENGEEILCLLDENFNRVYAPETSLLRLDTLDFDADRLLQDMGVYIILEPLPFESIACDLLPITPSGRLDYFNTQDGGMLGSACLARASQEFAKYDLIGKLYSIAIVKNLTVGATKKVPTTIVEDTLYIDVLTCTGSALREAVKTLVTK